MRKIIVTILTGFLCCLTALSQQKISVIARPAIIYVEKAENKQVLNFDFLVSNPSGDSLELSKLTVNVIGSNGKIIHSRFLDNNGTSPGIMLIPNRKFNGISSQLIFNPFTDFSLTIPLDKLEFEFIFSDKNDVETKVETVVNVKKYEQKQTLSFPLKGRLLVYDAHDFYAHHRRFDYEFAPIKGLGIRSNFMRYAYDFVLLDDMNQRFANDGKKDEDYFGFGKPVYAVGKGKVIYASNDHKDDKTFDIKKIATSPLELYGNCIAIQHPDHSVSIYGHLKQNSIKVKIDDEVSAQQEIAVIGVSGSSFFPHLHFEMRTSIQNDAEGIPCYFSNVYLSEGTTENKLMSGLVETGNIVIAK
ncbi:MAG: M23 family metallopeptidase [Ferruginibacter sp.]